MISVSVGYGTAGSRIPTIVARRSLSVIVLPITDGSLFSPVVQNRGVSTAAPAAPAPAAPPPPPPPPPARRRLVRAGGRELHGGPSPRSTTRRRRRRGPRAARRGR